MFLDGKRRWALLIASLVLAGTVLSAQAYADVSEDYVFTADILVGKNVSALLGNEEQRVFMSSVLLVAAIENIEDVRVAFGRYDPITKVYLASSPLSTNVVSVLLFTVDNTWSFTGNTISGQIVAGTMGYTIVPGAAEILMSSLQSEGRIGNYHQVSYSAVIARIYSSVRLDEYVAPETFPSYTPASLNQRMATRSGPGTKYTEELGTLPQDTNIVLIETVTTYGTPWGLVEFYRNGLKYRAYTGMKRINAYGPVAQGMLDYYEAILSRATAVYYGPGFDYVQREGKVPAGTLLRVYGTENGFALCDYETGGKWVRAYFPAI